MAAVLTNDARRGILNTAATTGGTLFHANIHLFTNPLTITPTTPLDSMVEATFNGYASAESVSFGTAFIDSDGRVTLTAPSIDFVASDGLVQEGVYGYYATDVGDTTLLGAEAFTNPVQINNAFDGLTVQPEVKYGT